MHAVMKRLTHSFKPLLGRAGRSKTSKTGSHLGAGEDRKQAPDSVPMIAVIPPLEDMHVYMDEDNLGNLIMRDVQCLPVVEDIFVACRSTTLAHISTEEAVDSKSNVQPSELTKASEPEQPKPLSVAEQRRKFIASLPLPPPPPIKPACQMPPELLTWMQLFQGDILDDEENGEGRTQFSETLSTQQLLVLSLLGKGAQGNVYLVKHRSKMVFYALKTIPKSTDKNGHYANLFAEQFALKMVAGDPRFVNLQGSFQDDECFYILTDLYAYGDLRSEMREVGKYGEEKARRYAVQIAVSVEALHKQRILHRDLKPDNLFLNSRHDIILGDFGLCRIFGRSIAEQPWRGAGVRAWMLPEDHPSQKQRMGGADKAKRVCGTPRYIAPEVYGLESDGWYSYSADIFSFGVILYELLHGKLPFGMKNDDVVEHLVVRTTRAELEVDQDVSEEAGDLLRLILAKDPGKRPSWAEIKQHAWFRSIEWDNVAPKSQPPTPIMFEHFDPSSEARATKFGKQTANNDPPYSFFDWTSPEIRCQPSVSTTSMYKVSRDWEPNADILEVMGWPVGCSQSIFATCPPTKPSPVHRTPLVVPGPLSTHQSSSAIVVQAHSGGPDPSTSDPSSMSPTSAVSLKGKKAHSQHGTSKRSTHSEPQALTRAVSALPASSPFSVLEVIDEAPVASRASSFDCVDIAKALDIMDSAILIHTRGEVGAHCSRWSSMPSNANVDATMTMPSTGVSPFFKCLGIDRAADLVTGSMALQPVRIRRDSSTILPFSDTVPQTLLDAGVIKSMSLASVLMDTPIMPLRYSSSATSSSSQGSADDSTSSTAGTGSSTHYWSRNASSFSPSWGSWGRLSSRVKGWWSSVAGAKEARRREKRRAAAWM
ncbi:kinase-like protein [Dichomitus squalens LYAD-421 SS1]|uniref:non-specific serine/threonine protein kinase n=1 Tax=Dichomitus squalens (strain LYAD-421) TaxID=732165 RepID=R7T0U2_DICSQ|nr:kinase-like protein [Dichomitus squalens LYAD-421 SS1]EJF61590.1 kinase-like protein [Dichomitus squalens LYAD-421 SS1]